MKHLPNDFHIKVPRGTIYRFIKIGSAKFLCISTENDDEYAPWPEDEILKQIECGVWTIVDGPKEKEEAPKELPDEFYFQVSGEGCVYKMARCGERFNCKHPNYAEYEGGWHTYGFTKNAVKAGSWVICKAPLTAEQQKVVKELKEQVAALESSIKLNQQSIEHYRRLIGNYTERMQELVRKIAEIENA